MKFDNLPEGHQDRGFALLKLRKVEELMKAEWFERLKQDGDLEVTPEMGRPGFLTNKKFLADYEVKKRHEIEMQRARSHDQERETEYQANV